MDSYRRTAGMPAIPAVKGSHPCRFYFDDKIGFLKDVQYNDGEVILSRVHCGDENGSTTYTFANLVIELD